MIISWMLIVVFFLKADIKKDQPFISNFMAPANPLDGCLHVYLDMGTNIGIQIRKVFEPSKFPGALALPIFEKYFGPPSSRDFKSVCAVGFEPNPDHTQHLVNLEDAYHKCGWKVLIHKETGVASRNSISKYSRIDGLPFAIGGRLVEEGESLADAVEVKSIWLAEFINEVVAKRKRPNGENGTVVMKVDVEGRESDIFPDIILSGALAHIDNIYVEWHNR